jgi:transposase
VRVKSVLIALLGLGTSVVICRWKLHDGRGEDRANLVVFLRRKARSRGRCGRCEVVAPWFDHDVGFATCELVAGAPRVNCPEHGPTVAHVSWARHDSWFSRAFEDVVVFDAICSNKLTAPRRHGVSWRAVNAMCVRVATEALGPPGPARSPATSPRPTPVLPGGEWPGRPPAGGRGQRGAAVP